MSGAESITKCRCVKRAHSSHPANDEGNANTDALRGGFDGPIRKKLFRPDKFDVALALNGGFFDRIQILLQTRELAGHPSRVLQGRRHGNDGITARHVATAFSASQRSGAT